MSRVFKIPSENGFIFLNTTSQEEIARHLANGGEEIASADVQRIFGDYACLVCPDNTRLDADGQIVFTPPEEAYLDKVAWENLRFERDIRLNRCDFQAMPDYPLEEGQKTLLQNYRQALRDITASPAAPFRNGEIPWPEKPEFVR